MKSYAVTLPVVDDSIKLDLKFEKATMLDVLNTLKKKTALNFVYNHEEIKGIPLITKEFKKATVSQILVYCLTNTSYTFSIVNDVVIIKKKSQQGDRVKIMITGIVSDEKGEPLPGATVLLKGTSLGVATDGNGTFKFELPKSENMVLLVNFIGMKTREILITKSDDLKIILESAATSLDDVVVNGFYTKNKNTFTGSVTTVKGEELIKASNKNLIQALSVMVPGLRIVENNEQGSNPNAIPDIIIRGTTSLMTEGEVGINTPLVILDGVEITMAELYDLDVYDIERVDVLKDASATVLYGERATNGVILIERTRVKDSKVKFSYNFVPDFSFPDLSSMDLCNAEQKLELERIAGLYNSAEGKYDRAYAYKLEQIRKGVDTDWISKPLRNSFSHSHSVNVSGRGGGMDYRANGRFKDTYGVMKGDYRRAYGVNFMLNYHLSDKLTVSYRFDFSMTDSKDSPYGSFSTYTKLNPYEAIYDEDGEYRRSFHFDPFHETNSPTENPLYNATLSSFSKSKNKSITNSIDLRWDIKRNLYITGQISLALNDSKSDQFTSPEDSKYDYMNKPNEMNLKGEYKLGQSDGTSYDGKLVVNYSRPLGEHESVVGIHAGTDFARSKTNKSSMTAVGFLRDELNDLSYATKYDGNSSPSGSENLSTRVGFFVTADYSYRNRYFIDVSYRTSGSSKFGRDQQFAPFWSGGIGWNIHNESFMNFDWLNMLRLRASMGYTGNVNFSAYQAITTYKYSTDNRYYTGVGALPITMGNPNLKWQKTLSTNYGLSTDLFDSRLSFTFDYYEQLTKDLLLPIDVPYSVGVSNVKVNFGEVKNAGIDFSLSGHIVKNKTIYWMLSVNGSHTYDKINRISDALKRQNAENAEGDTPKIQFKEGGSQYAIYAVRSAGIDPATGKEIFISKDGNYTFDYNADDQVEVGNTNPTLQGNISSYFSYKGFSLNISAAYTFGGDVYNQTLADKVENINARVNVDRRAFTERWKNPGDQVRFLGIPEGRWSTYITERFVERKNEIYISNINFNYEFSTKKLQKIGLKRLLIGIGVSDIGRLSTVKYERGTSYPYCRSFNFTLRPVF